MRTPMLMAGLVVAAAAAVASAEAQVLDCTLRRMPDGSFAGTCGSGDQAAAELHVTAPVSGTSTLWRGRGKLSWRRGEEPVAIDLRHGGTLRTGTAWLDLADVDRGEEFFSFRIDLDRITAPSEVDRLILLRLRHFFATAEKWSRGDDRHRIRDVWKGPRCEDVEERTFVCALYWASIEVADEYWHGRPAVAALRDAILSTVGQAYRHPLADLNDAPGTDLATVQRVIDEALALLEKRMPVAATR